MKKLNVILIILILLLSFTLIGDCTWLDGWDYRIELSIGDYAGDIGEIVFWFPVTIFLKDANGDSTEVFLEVGANSRKIAITKNDGTTELKGEIEDWSYDAGTPANSVAVIHTSATGWTIAGNTSIWLYYDNDHADNANVDVINTVAGAAVWDANFKAVYHMVDDNGNVDDSTSNDNDGTKTSVGSPVEAEGKVGQAQDFDGSDDYIKILDSVAGGHSFVDLSDNITLSAWINADDVGDGANEAAEWVANETIVELRTETSTGTHVPFNFGLHGTKIALGVTDDHSNGAERAVADTTLLVETDYHIAVTIDGDSWIFYKDGVSDGNGTFSSATGDRSVGAVTSNLQFGCRTRNAGERDVNLYNGRIDEARISDTTRTAAWIKGTYNSGNDDLLTYGSEETSEVEPTYNYYGHFIK